MGNKSDSGQPAPMNAEQFRLFPIYIDVQSKPKSQPVPPRTKLVTIVHRVDVDSQEFVHKLPGDPRGMTDIS